MTKLGEPRFENGRAMLLAGIRRHHTFGAGSKDIPAQWGEFVALGRLPGQVGDTTYGAMCGADEQARTFEYLCGAEVASFDGLPKGMGRMKIAPQQYAVFTHSGSVDAIHATWNAAVNEWLPKSGYRSAQKPDFERYDERFDPTTASGDVELWISVVPAQS